MATSRLRIDELYNQGKKKDWRLAGMRENSKAIRSEEILCLPREKQKRGISVAELQQVFQSGEVGKGTKEIK